jgi:hypothetical protein
MRIEAAAQAASGTTSEIQAVLDGYRIRLDRMTQREWAHDVAVTAASSPPAGDAA